MSISYSSPLSFYYLSSVILTDKRRKTKEENLMVLIFIYTYIISMFGGSKYGRLA